MTNAGAPISSTGLAIQTASTLAYLAGPLSGALFLLVERSNRDVRFHAWQALMGLGALALTSVVCLGLAFLMLIVSPGIFRVLLWMAALAGVAFVGLWAVCLVYAYKGQRWKIPLVGDRAERLAGQPEAGRWAVVRRAGAGAGRKG